MNIQTKMVELLRLGRNIYEVKRFLETLHWKNIWIKQTKMTIYTKIEYQGKFFFHNLVNQNAYVWKKRTV